MRYSIQIREWIFVKGFLTFPSKKYKWKRKWQIHTAKKFLITLNNSDSKKKKKKKREATVDLISNKISDRITKVSRSSETIKNKHDK